MPVFLHVAHGIMAECSCHRDCGPKPKCFALWPSLQKVYRPWSQAPPALEAFV